MEPTKTPAKVIAALALYFVARSAVAALPSRRGASGHTTRVLVFEVLRRGDCSAALTSGEAAPILCLQPAAAGYAARPDPPLTVLVVDQTRSQPRIVTASGRLFGLVRVRTAGDAGGVLDLFALLLPRDSVLVAAWGPPGPVWAVVGNGDSWGERVVCGDGSTIVLRAKNVGKGCVLPFDGVQGR